jgi:hypothetical protein
MATVGEWLLFAFGVLMVLAAIGAVGEGKLAEALGFGLFGLVLISLALLSQSLRRRADATAAAKTEAERRALEAETARRAYEAAPKCPFCGQPNTLQEKSRTIVGQTKGFGMVERVEKHTGIYGDPSRTKEIRRQERVPTVTTSTRIEYVCSYCMKSSTRDFTATIEDFSREARPSSSADQRLTINIPPPPPQIMRRCTYCKAIYAEGRLTCPKCGASF